MQRESAKKLVDKVFDNPFNEINFYELVMNIFNIESNSNNILKKQNILLNSTEFNSIFCEYIESYCDILNVDFEERDSLLVSIVKLKTNKNIKRGRSIQRNFIVQRLKELNKEACLCAFYEDNTKSWRLSLVTIDYKFSDGKLEEYLSEAKRYSYLIDEFSNNYTVKKQIFSLLTSKNINIEKLKNIFNVEIVSNEFFNLYRDRYKDLRNFLINNDEFIQESKRLGLYVEKFASEFSKKLMGQLAFLYFLQKKGWLGVEIIPKRILRHEYEEFYNKIKEDYLKAILDEVYIHNNTYYELDFNKKNNLPDDRLNDLLGCFHNSKFDKKWGEGDKNFIRTLFKYSVENENNFFNDYLEHLFYNALNQYRGDIQYYRKFNKKIPFLNGGLFEPLYGYDWIKTNIKIDNTIFSNKDKNGILDVFDLFNFTISEDEPLEREVAIDPEMLGKVFESLLDIDERKSQGTYYTAREIVYHMCEEEVINYLLVHTDLDYNILEKIIRYKEFDYIEKLCLEDILKIDKLLETITVVDPSVGSGAFLVGMLNLIVIVRKQLRESEKSKNILSKVSIYDLKLHSLKYSIYGVDIEKGAIEITKLRLWLSLIVDAIQIVPLPNLDFNVQVGNSLIDEHLGCKLLNIQNISSDDIYNIYNYKNKYFDTHNQIEKNNIRNKILELQLDLISSDNLIFKTLQPDELKDNNAFFDWHLAFSQIFLNKKGFDIVIGNPPYVGQKGNKNIFDLIRKTRFGNEFFQRKIDLFYFFFHKSIDISNEKGTIGLITTNYFITATEGTKLREDIRKRTNIIKMINFNEMKVFDSAKGQHNIITFLSKNKKPNYFTKCIVSNRKGFFNSNILIDTIQGRDEMAYYFNLNEKDIYTEKENYIMINSLTNNYYDNSILEKIKNGNNFLDYYCNINQGLVTGADKVTDKHINSSKNCPYNKNDGIYILDKSEIEKLNLSRNEFNIIKPFYKNSNIDKYTTNKNDNKFVIYASPEIDILDYPQIEKHFEKYESIIRKRRRDIGNIEDKVLGGKWWVLSYSRKKYIFENEKIVVPQRNKFNKFAYSNEDWYASADVYFITSKINDINLKYILALLNSKLYYYWLYFKGKRKGDYLELYSTPLKEIPIKKASSKDENLIVKKINTILEISKQNISNIEKDKQIFLISQEIDNIIYNIYNLTDNEISIIENLYSKKLL